MELLSKLSLPELLALQWLNNISRYLLIAGMTYLIFWKWFFLKWQERFLYSKHPEKSDLQREVKYSILTTAIFILPTLVVATLNRQWGVSLLYYDIQEKGVPWYVISFFVVFFIHDTYFYWTHRLMHHRKLFQLFHRTHHLSVHPTPLAAFAFHPLEALTESFIFLLIPLIIPVHWTVLIVFTLFSLFMNVYGHLGFNLFKPERMRKFPLNLLNHSTHHSWHHQYQRGNYGFYLQFWDRAMGTWKGELPTKINA